MRIDQSLWREDLNSSQQPHEQRESLSDMALARSRLRLGIHIGKDIVLSKAFCHSRLIAAALKRSVA